MHAQASYLRMRRWRWETPVVIFVFMRVWWMSVDVCWGWHFCLHKTRNEGPLCLDESRTNTITPSICQCQSTYICGHPSDILESARLGKFAYVRVRVCKPCMWMTEETPQKLWIARKESIDGIRNTYKLTKGGDHSGKTHLISSLIINIKEEESIVTKDHVFGAVLPFVCRSIFRSADVGGIANSGRRFRLWVCSVGAKRWDEE